MLLQWQISFTLMVSHARVNEGLSQGPAPGRRPLLEEKPHHWRFPRRHGNLILFDMVPMEMFPEAATRVVRGGGVGSVAESKRVHSRRCLGTRSMGDGVHSGVGNHRSSWWERSAKRSKLGQKKIKVASNYGCSLLPLFKSAIVHLSIRGGFGGGCLCDPVVKL